MSAEAFNRLKEIKENFPELTYIAKGYDGLSREIVDKHTEQINEITEILKSEFSNFRRFQNFTPRKDGTFSIRCQCAYDAMFTGVVYLDESH
ncbi:MAG: hypothetical protein DI622_22960, partial [Chryseobacterium sp.]